MSKQSAAPTEETKRIKTIPQLVSFFKKECLNFSLKWPVKTR